VWRWTLTLTVKFDLDDEPSCHISRSKVKGHFFESYCLDIQTYRHTTADFTWPLKWSLIKTSASVTNWCMSPHGIAGPPDHSSRNSGNKCRLARPLTVPNFGTLRQKVLDMSAVENLCCRKSGPKCTKIGENLLRTMSVIMLISSCSAKREKSVRKLFLHLSIFWDLLSHSSPIYTVVYSKAPSINLPNFATFWKPVYEILAAKSSSISGTAWPTHKQTKNKQ